jgi:hypothetical protein
MLQMTKMITTPTYLGTTQLHTNTNAARNAAKWLQTMTPQAISFEWMDHDHGLI